MTAAAVFETYELLEHTLLHLPTKDLLLCQRVCKQWRALVQRSRRARKALFIDHIAPDDDYQDMGDLGRLYGGCHRECQMLLMNPLFNTYLDHNYYSAPTHKIMPMHFGLVNPTNVAHPQARVKAGNMGTYSKTASWKGMLLTQPPPQRLVLACEEREPFAQYDLQASHGHGFRLGEVVEQLRTHWYECPNCRIRSTEEDDLYPEPPASYCTLQVDGHVETLRSDITGWEVLEKLTQDESKINCQGE